MEYWGDWDGLWGIMVWIMGQNGMDYGGEWNGLQGRMVCNSSMGGWSMGENMMEYGEEWDGVQFNVLDCGFEKISNFCFKRFDKLACYLFNDFVYYSCVFMFSE